MEGVAFEVARDLRERLESRLACASVHRSSNHRGLLFYRLLEQAVQLEHVPLVAIVGGRSL